VLFVATIISTVASLFCLWLAASYQHIFVNGYIVPGSEKIIHDPELGVRARHFVLPIAIFAILPIARLLGYWARFWRRYWGIKRASRSIARNAPYL
jgi:hypothetical protein